MPTSTQIVDWLTLGLISLGLLVIALTKTALETGVKKTVVDALADMDWPDHLQKALQKSRGLERQGLRFKCYGALWSKLRPLALYGARPLDRASAGALSGTISDWYFSPTGGLLLTKDAREFYFALQNLLRTVSATSSDWLATPVSADQREIAMKALARFNLREAMATREYFRQEQFDNWSDVAHRYGMAWNAGLQTIAQEPNWLALSENERFAVLQQAGSILRASLTIDIESRLR